MLPLHRTYSMLVTALCRMNFDNVEKIVCDCGPCHKKCSLTSASSCLPPRQFSNCRLTCKLSDTVACCPRAVPHHRTFIPSAKILGTLIRHICIHTSPPLPWNSPSHAQDQHRSAGDRNQFELGHDGSRTDRHVVPGHTSKWCTHSFP